MSDTNQDFGFPFEPYDVQVSFMKALYNTLHNGKIGIFESPTGTGKSLSLICGSLTWLAEFKRTRAASLAEEIAELSQQIARPVTADDWIVESAQRIRQKNRLTEVKLQYERIQNRDKKFENLKRNAKVRKREMKVNADFPEISDKSISDELSCVRQIISEVNDSESREELLEDYGSEASDSDSDESDEDPPLKIIYCSRTHSQLSQFVRELKRTPHGEKTRTVHLGSRQNMCINEAVTKLGSLALMNEKCLDMQKRSTSKILTGSPPPKRKKSASGTSCPFHKQQTMEALCDSIHVEAKDIEDLVESGRKLKACPYYSARHAIPEAELVVVPYNILFQKSTREACHLRLKGNVVIIDEAHNLLETINNSYSVQINGHALAQSYTLLGRYLTKYMSRLNVKNVMYIKQIIHILRALVGHLGELSKSEAKVYQLTDFFLQIKIEQFNMFKILRYFERSQIALKLRAFGASSAKDTPNHAKSAFAKLLESVEKPPTKSEQQQPSTEVADKLRQSSNAPLVAVQEFFRALTGPSADGRLVCRGSDEISTSSIKYVQLNPAAHFGDIVSEARAVVLAGGTMQPTSEFVDQLLVPAGAEPSRIVHFECGHVVPKTNLLAVALSRGPSSKTFEFTYRTREDPEMVQELGRALINVCQIIPGGIVCFFPSYDSQLSVHKKWNSTGILERLKVRKQIFCEPRKSSEVEKVLDDYARCIERAGSGSSGLNGAVLFSVVGGKMSEGINFSDDMGRCVVVVGLPFPNSKSPEMAEKMAFLDAKFPREADGRTAGQVYYDNACMKAVNQSIGRAIRHRADYATILLLDRRYRRPSVAKALPTWIRASLREHDNFGSAFADIRNFFSRRPK